MARADTTDRETLKLMRDAGLYAVKFGVESGDQKVLDLSGKKLNLKTVEKTVRYAKELGIKTHLTFSIGLLGETHQSAQKTIEFAIDMDPDSVQCSITVPFPGTQYYKYLKDKNYLLTEDEHLFDGGDTCVLRTEELIATDIEYYHSLFNKKWRKNKITKRIKKIFIK
jgi:radical SAM superfamily enzyme YgiQ (UPF0313 family)